jgi:phosphohistidine swiveling domain-containing protein
MSKYSLLNQDINTSFLNIETTWAGMRSPLIKKQVGSKVPDSFCENIKGETLNYFQNTKQAKKFSHLCAENVLSNKKLLLSTRKKTLELSSSIIKLAENNFPLSNLSKKEIVKLLIKARNLQKDLASWGMVVAFADIYGEISELLIKIFSTRKDLRHPVNFYLDILANPTEKSLTIQAYKNIVLNRNNKYLLKKYFWLDQGYIGRGLDLKQIENIRRHYREQKIKHKITKNSLLEELNLSEKELNILNVSAEMVYIKSLRSDSRQALYTVVNRIVDLLSIEFNLPGKYLEILPTHELISYINNPHKIPSNLAERWQRSVLIPKSLDDYGVIVGEKVCRYLNKHLEITQEQADDVIELKGQIAQPGKAQGRVKLVFGSQHNFKVKRGDILVSVSTSPQLLPAMKLSAAFITDMGGITSHAAIVSRELKTPCIVGTKIATRVLHDGDLVEVDANQGVIKIIKRK